MHIHIQLAKQTLTYSFCRLSAPLVSLSERSSKRSNCSASLFPQTALPLPRTVLVALRLHPSLPPPSALLLPPRTSAAVLLLLLQTRLASARRPPAASQLRPPTPLPTTMMLTRTSVVSVVGRRSRKKSPLTTASTAPRRRSRGGRTTGFLMASPTSVRVAIALRSLRMVSRDDRDAKWAKVMDLGGCWIASMPV